MVHTQEVYPVWYTQEGIPVWYTQGGIPRVLLRRRYTQGVTKTEVYPRCVPGRMYTLGVYQAGGIPRVCTMMGMVVYPGCPWWVWWVYPRGEAQRGASKAILWENSGKWAHLRAILLGEYGRNEAHLRAILWEKRGEKRRI